MERLLKEDELESIYNWVDEVPLSRPKRNMARDFSDAVLMAEIIAHYNPKIVELHNYIETGSVSQKLANWKTLNEKVLKKMKIVLNKEDMDNLANCVPNQIQKLMWMVRKYIIEEGPTPTVTSKVSKVSRMTMGIGEKKKKEKKVYTLKDSLRIKEVSEVIDHKDKCIQLLKEQVEILYLKFGKLEDMVKSKDKQIEELVRKIKAKGVN